MIKVLKNKIVLLFIFLLIVICPVVLGGCSGGLDGIVSIEKTSVDGNVETYTVTLQSGETYTFDIINNVDDNQDVVDDTPKEDNGQNETIYVVGIEKTASDGLVDTYTISYSNGTTSTFEITNGKNGVDGKDGADGKDGNDGNDGADGSDGKSITIQDIYNAYVEEYGEISYSDFVSKYLGSSVSDNSAVINKCLLSCMKVYTEFATTTQELASIGYWGPVYQDIKKVSIKCGSAIIFEINDDETYILTNYHVVYGSTVNEDNGGNIARNIYGYLYGSEGSPAPVKNGDEYATDEKGYQIYDYGNYGIKLTFVGGSSAYDIAVLKVDTSVLRAINEQVKAVEFADGYHVGETAIAIGNPENEGISVTQGIVSVDNEYVALAVDEVNVNYYRSIRIDTSIYGGSSGGGLFDSEGKLIGITNAGNQQDQNINYAIPIEVIRSVVDNIKYYYDGENSVSVHKVIIGVTVASKNSRYVYDVATGYGKIKEDVMVDDIIEDSIVANLGLQVGDCITGLVINGKANEIARYFEIGDMLLSVRPGDKIAIMFKRDGEQLTTDDYTILESDLHEV